MTKTELMELSKKICLILSKQENTGNKLHCSYQGGGKALFLKIVVTKGDEKFLKAAKKFLTGDLSLSLTQEPHHGKGGKNNTLLVPLFGIKEESLEKINSLSQGIVHVEKIIQSYKKIVESSEKEEVIEQTSSVPIVAHKREMSDPSKYRLSLSRYLRPIMEMEGITPDQFPFDKDINGGMIVVHCQNEEIAKMIEISISYTSSFTSKSVVEREGSLVMVDGPKFYGLDHKPFAFPPKEGQDLATLLLKVQSIFPSKLEISKKGEKRFFITFRRDNAAQIAIKILKDLEWNLLGFYSTKSICLKYGYAVQKEVAIVPSVATAPSAPAPVSRTHYASHKPYVSGLSSLNKSIVPSSNDDIIKELKSIADSGNLSPETMERIQRVLLDDIKKKQEEYAKILLAKLGY